MKLQWKIGLEQRGTWILSQRDWTKLNKQRGATEDFWVKGEHLQSCDLEIDIWRPQTNSGLDYQRKGEQFGSHLVWRRVIAARTEGRGHAPALGFCRLLSFAMLSTRSLFPAQISLLTHISSMSTQMSPNLLMMPPLQPAFLSYSFSSFSEPWLIQCPKTRSLPHAHLSISPTTIITDLPPTFCSQYPWLMSRLQKVLLPQCKDDWITWKYLPPRLMPWSWRRP